MAILNYGRLEDYKALAIKNPKALYFLDNHQVYKGDDLISNVRTVDSFPEETAITADMRLNIFINLSTGEIRYVTYDKKYINLSNVLLNNIRVTVNQLKEFYDNVQELEVTMPQISVSEETLVLIPSNVTTETFYVKKSN